ncbi:hypothetical protein ACFC8F_11770 [Streptomyces hydrogenans]|uniref:hypothetical protein n=1 Tax=Streptomyces hydrogenans TaxID=1873719 RepID=UPI0035E3AA65
MFPVVAGGMAAVAAVLRFPVSSVVLVFGNAEAISVAVLVVVTFFVTTELLFRGPSGTKRCPREGVWAAG